MKNNELLNKIVNNKKLLFILPHLIYISQLLTKKCINQEIVTLKSVFFVMLILFILTTVIYFILMKITDARGEAEQNVRIKAAVAEIARLENFTIADEEMADALNAICQQNKITMEQLTEVYDPEFEEAVVQSLMARKAVECIRSHAKITVVVE